MSFALKDAKQLKIVPENYESATVFEISEENEKNIVITLPYLKEEEKKDYKKGSSIEAFGVAKSGLIYFISKILKINDNTFTLEKPSIVKEIQRRKYSRVPFAGELTVKEAPNVKIKTDDISAGGLKFYSDTPFMVGSEYKIIVQLVNNLQVNCTMQPIRVEESDEFDDVPYSISAKFKKIRSIDRIALMQYSLRLISEKENKSK